MNELSGERKNVIENLQVDFIGSRNTRHSRGYSGDIDSCLIRGGFTNKNGIKFTFSVSSTARIRFDRIKGGGKLKEPITYFDDNGIIIRLYRPEYQYDKAVDGNWMVSIENKEFAQLYEREVKDDSPRVPSYHTWDVVRHFIMDKTGVLIRKFTDAHESRRELALARATNLGHRERDIITRSYASVEVVDGDRKMYKFMADELNERGRRVRSTYPLIDPRTWKVVQ